MLANVFRSSVAKVSALAMPVRSVLASQTRVFSTDNVTQTYDHSVKNDGAGSQDIVWSEGLITREDRTKLTGRKGATIWLTGLSGSGKSTIACQLEKELLDLGVHCYRLDGDNIRFGLNKGLGFSAEDREVSGRGCPSTLLGSAHTRGSPCSRRVRRRTSAASARCRPSSPTAV
jgi:hypothetical protein